MRQHFDNRDLRTESGQQTSKLTANYAATDDCYRLRNRFRVNQVIRGDNRPAVKGEGWNIHWFRAGCNDNLISLNLNSTTILFFDHDVVFILECAKTAVGDNAVRLE